jgi:phosphoribosylanthranilate isomerase
MLDTQMLSSVVSEGTRLKPQVKICGLTREDEALACAELGADAIGGVFYPRSPRHLSEEQARGLFRSLPATVCKVGVFVNEPFSTIMQRVDHCGLNAVQLHGRESPDLVDELRKTGIIVVKAIFVNGTPSLMQIDSFNASAYLIECAGGTLPGGNALKWDWSAAAGISERRAVILAGGLNPANIALAIQYALPDAVDVSSGVESSPGRKDLEKVKRLLQAVASAGCPARKPRRVFQ